MRISILAVNPKTIVTAVVVCLIIAVVLGLILAVASKFLKVEQDERIDKVA